MSDGLEADLRRVLDWALREDPEGIARAYVDLALAPLAFDGKALVAPARDVHDPASAEASPEDRVVISLSPGRRVFRIFVGRRGRSGELSMRLPLDIRGTLG